MLKFFFRNYTTSNKQKLKQQQKIINNLKYSSPSPSSSSSSSSSSSRTIPSNSSISSEISKKDSILKQDIKKNEIIKYNKRVFISNLNLNCKWKELKEYFQQIGQVGYASISIDMKTKESKGCGIVQYDKEEDLHKAIKELNGKEFMGNILKLRIDKKDLEREKKNQNKDILKDNNTNNNNNNNNEVIDVSVSDSIPLNESTPTSTTTSTIDTPPPNDTTPTTTPTTNPTTPTTTKGRKKPNNSSKNNSKEVLNNTQNNLQNSTENKISNVDKNTPPTKISFFPEYYDSSDGDEDDDEDDDNNSDNHSINSKNSKNIEKQKKKEKKSKKKETSKSDRYHYRIFVSGLPLTYKWTDVKDLFKVVGRVNYCDIYTYEGTGKSKGTAVVEFESKKHVAKAIKKLNGVSVEPEKMMIRVEAFLKIEPKALTANPNNSSTKSLTDSVTDSTNSLIPTTPSKKISKFSELEIIPPLVPVLRGIPLPNDIKNSLALMDDRRVYFNHFPRHYDWKIIKDTFSVVGPIEFVDLYTDKHTGKSRGCGLIKFATVNDAKKAVEMFHLCKIDDKTIDVIEYHEEREKRRDKDWFRLKYGEIKLRE